jgi:branched-chain amino acid aminotransferase
MRVWLNGDLVAPENACIGVADRGFLLGDGVFETIAVHNGRPFDLAAHLSRLASGLAVLGFAGAVDIEALGANVRTYAESAGAASAVLRVTVTRGKGPRGLTPPTEPRPSVVMTLAPAPPAHDQAVSLHIATTTRRNELSPISRIKALSYVDNLVALQEARSLGSDDALMLNTCGAVVCASTSNLFIIREGKLQTPPIADGALPGTTRAMLLALAQDAGLAPMETSLFANDVAEADHVLLTNSVRGVVEADHCDGAALARRAAEAVRRLRELIAARVAEG